FYFQRGNDVRSHHLREQVQLADAATLISHVVPGGVPGGVAGGVPGDKVALARAGRVMAPAMVMPLPEPPSPPAATRQFDAYMDREKKSANGANEDTPIQTRIDFNALAFFAASLPTDANGRASVKVKLPDNLTRYRVMAVAVAGEKQFGIGE